MSSFLDEYCDTPVPTEQQPRWEVRASPNGTSHYFVDRITGKQCRSAAEIERISVSSPVLPSSPSSSSSSLARRQSL